MMPDRDQLKLITPKKPSAAIRRAGKGKRKTANVGSAWRAYDAPNVQAFAQWVAAQ